MSQILLNDLNALIRHADDTKITLMAARYDLQTSNPTSALAYLTDARSRTQNFTLHLRQLTEQVRKELIK